MTDITLNHITKVEGHAELDLKIENGKVKVCKLGSVEGARFFEGMIRGKRYDEAYEICSRICGICSCGHTITGLKAIENALGIKVTKQTEILRQLITIGERIRSHLSHLYFFVLPDYAGYESAIAMIPKFKNEVTKAIELIHMGNNFIKLIGGRDMHPFTSIPGGFTQIPKDDDLKGFAKQFKQAKADVIKIIKFFGELAYPKFEIDTTFVSIKGYSGFSLHEGVIVSNDGSMFESYEYKDYLKEHIVDYSTAKFAVVEGKEYSTGALARMNNNMELLSKSCKKIIKEGKIKFPSNNPFYQNYAQAIEVLHWLEKAIELIESNTFVDEKPVEVKLNGNLNGNASSRGVACIEVPRGMLFHDYTIDGNGFITDANIITPTVQNLANLNRDIKEYVDFLLKHDKKITNEKLVLEIEKLIRSYDPCFSCSTHFLKVNWV